MFFINKIYFLFRCSRGHPYPEISNTLMFSNMYNHFELEQGLKDDLDTTGNFNDLLNIFVKYMIHCSCMYVRNPSKSREMLDAVITTNNSFLCFYILVSLFVWGFSSHLRIFHTYGDVIAAEGLQILTYARQLWPLSSEGSQACHTYCDMGQRVIIVISEGL